MRTLSRLGFCAALATAFALALAQQDHRLAPNGNSAPAPKPFSAMPVGWNDAHKVLIKGTIKGIMTSAQYTDKKQYVLLLVALSNGGTAMVELGPKEYVDAQGLYLRTKEQIWVAGCKTWVNENDSIILAQRVNYRGDRPSFRKEDGSPFWK